MSLSIVNQVRFYNSVICFDCYVIWGGREAWLFSQRPIHDTVLPVNFSLWFMLLFIHKVATYLRVS